MTYPLNTPPAGFAHLRCTGRNGIVYEGDNVTLTLSQAGPTAYEVFDYWGTSVDSGAVSGTSLDLGSSWPLGWYRVRLTNAVNDAVFGYSRGAMNFSVIPADPNFPTLPPDSVSVSGGSEVQELITKPCLGIGTSRISIFDVADPNGGGGDTLDNYADVTMPGINEWWLNPAYADPVRERKQWMAFPDGCVDAISFVDAGQVGYRVFEAYVKDASINGAQVFLKTEAGSVSGFKLTVRFPDAATVAETYDNVAFGSGSGMAASIAAINAASSYVQLFYGGWYDDMHYYGPTAIGNDLRAGVIEIVSTLYPLGVTHYEGYNEPDLDRYGENFAWQYMLFQDAVHTGHADAQCMGPAAVAISTLEDWRVFLDAGGGDYLDAVSFHDYNSFVNADWNIAKYQIQKFKEMLADYNLDGLELWQTEACHSLNSVFGVYHPRRAKQTLAHVLLWEQFGVPAERNPYWYDWSHGFWGYPSFMFTISASTFPDGLWGDRGTEAQAILWATLGRETFGKLFHHPIDFGSVAANSIFAGNVYGDANTGSVAAMMAMSYMPDSTVTLTIHGTTDDLEVVDCFGNVTEVAQTAGRITVDVADVFTFVRLPVGVNATVYAVRDWGPSPNVSISQAAFPTTIGGVQNAVFAQNGYMTQYTGTDSPGLALSTVVPPDSIELFFDSAITVERLIGWFGAYQSLCALIDYDVETWDGADWTTQVTVTKDTPTSVLHGTTATDVGCSRETFWSEQWIEDVTLPAPVSCDGVRFYVREISYGGEGDVAAATVNAGFGQATLDPHLTVQQVAVISSTELTPAGSYPAQVLADSPLGYWRMEETSGTAVASTVNSPTLDGVASGSYVRGIPGLINVGLAFSSPSGTPGIVTVTHNALLDFGDTFTYECWYRPTDPFVGQFRRIFYKGTFLPQLIVNTTGHVFLQRESSSTVVATASVALAVNSINHIVCTKSGATTKIYLNGQDVTIPGTNVTFGTIGANFVIGSANHNDFDECAVYGTALTADRVLAHYTAGIATLVPEIVSVPLVFA